VRYIYKAILAALCFALASCAAPLTKAKHDDIHSVAVISLLGDRISLRKTALITGGFAEKVPVADIGFDALAENSLMECLKAGDPSRTFQIIDIPKQPLMDKLYDDLLSRYNATMSRIRPDISAWVKQNPVDAIVIVREVYSQVPGGPSEYFGGVGVHQFLDQTPIVQAVFGLVIWDGKTLDELTDLSYSPIAGRYGQPVDVVFAELKAGHHIPRLESMLKPLVGSGTCAMAKASNL